MPEGYSGLPSYYTSSAGPITPNLGLSLKGSDPVVAENFVLIDTFAGSAGAISVNGSVVSGANFNNLLPAAPLGGTNVLWQHSGSSVSAYVVIPAAGTFPVTFAAVPSNWLNSYSSVTGLFTATQPTFTDLSAHPTTLSGYGITDAIPASVMTTLGDTLYENVTPAPTRLAGNITTTKMYLSQTGTGAVSAAPAWAQINYADIAGTTPTPPSGSVLWSALGNAAAGLTLANAGYATTFNQTSAVNWTWANTTVGTVSSTNASPLLNLAANYWATGGATGVDSWSLGIAALTAGLNSPSTLTFTHSGSTGSAAVQVPLLNIGGTDAGISRLAAGYLSIGNGTAGDTSGNLRVGNGSGGAPSDPLPTSGNLRVGNGSGGAPSYSFGGAGSSAYQYSSGMFVTNGYLGLSYSGTIGFVVTATQAGASNFSLGSGGVQGWNSAAGALGTNDAGISRLGAASLAVGNGTAGDATGGVHAGSYALGTGTASTQGMYGSGSTTIIRGAGIAVQATGGQLALSGSTSAYLGSAAGAVSINIAGANIVSSDKTALGDGLGAFQGALYLFASDAGISRLGAASLAVGNGTAGDFTGTLKCSSVNVANGTAAVPTLAFYSDAASGAGFCSTANGTAGGVFTCTSGVLLRTDFAFGTTLMFAGGLGFSALNTTSDTTGRNISLSPDGTHTAGLLLLGNGTLFDYTGTLKLNTVICAGGVGTTTILDYNTGLRLFFGCLVGFGATTSLDTGISRLGAASLAVGNGTASDVTGKLTLGTLVATAAAPTVAAAQIGYGSTTSATANTTGGGLTLPLLAAGYIIVNIAGTNYKVPYYAA